MLPGGPPPAESRHDIDSVRDSQTKNHLERLETPPPSRPTPCLFAHTRLDPNQLTFFLLNQDIQVLVGISKHTRNSFSNTCPASHPWACRGYRAAQCSLFPCIWSFTGTVNVSSSQYNATISTVPAERVYSLSDAEPLSPQCFFELNFSSQLDVGVEAVGGSSLLQMI